MKDMKSRIDLASVTISGEDEIRGIASAYSENNIRRMMFGILPPAVGMSNFPDLVVSASYAAATAEIVSTWTMFESLAADLWVAVVNAFPDPLATLSGNWKRLRRNGKKEGDDGDITEDEGKSISLAKVHKITRGSYDIQYKMGEVLLACNRVKFISLEGIRRAYGMAFSEDYRIKPTAIDNALKSESLDCVSALRNVIVHRAGIADQRYEDDAKGVGTAPKLKRGEKLSIVQEDARALADPVSATCVALMEAVDQWMKIKRGEIK